MSDEAAILEIQMSSNDFKKLHRMNFALDYLYGEGIFISSGLIDSPQYSDIKTNLTFKLRENALRTGIEECNAYPIFEKLGIINTDYIYMHKEYGYDSILHPTILGRYNYILSLLMWNYKIVQREAKIVVSEINTPNTSMFRVIHQIAKALKKEKPDYMLIDTLAEGENSLFYKNFKEMNHRHEVYRLFTDSIELEIEYFGDINWLKRLHSYENNKIYITDLTCRETMQLLVFHTITRVINDEATSAEDKELLKSMLEHNEGRF